MKNVFDISVSTLPFLEPLLAQEMKALGVSEIQTGKRIVHGVATKQLLYEANFKLRTALRVYVPLQQFNIRHSDELYKRCLQIDWSEYLRIDQTFAIEPNVRSYMFKHPHFASLRLKDAIADFFNQKYGRRPDVNPENPDVLFHLHMDEHRVTISLDSSGESLNRRGYRQLGAKAPLNEVLAAAMILHTGWKGEMAFYDPMCGSGTLAIEAAMIAADIPSQINRKSFGFMRWENFDKGLWESVVQTGIAGMKTPGYKIYASDADKRQLDALRTNVAQAGLGELIDIKLADLLEVQPNSDKGILVMNPPYGERLQEHEDITLLYARIGTHLKHHWGGHTAWIISSNIDALKSIGLKPGRKIEMMNGPLSCSFRRFDLFSGKRIDHVKSS